MLMEVRMCSSEKMMEGREVENVEVFMWKDAETLVSQSGKAEALGNGGSLFVGATQCRNPSQQ